MKNKKREPVAKKASSQTPIEEQTRNQTEQQQASVDVDEVNLNVSYANGFRTSASAEEVVVDFGLNYIQPPDQQTGEQKMAFKANERIIMNYFSAKRLTLALSQIVRRYEQEFGVLELDATKRQVRSNKK